ncbi:hypothetical protein EDB19DRAFT_1728275 [Suillus lakei]|nr:hypothetical protein EDB19DRAFT_1728275 [Suillus lakei]
MLSYRTVVLVHLSTVSHSMVAHWAADWSRIPLVKPKDEIVREGKKSQLRNRTLNSRKEVCVLPLTKSTRYDGYPPYYMNLLIQ